MKRSFSGLGVTAAGLLLAGGGVYGMWEGWDKILLERGWSLFIAGSVALSGGVVTMALGRVIAHLARLAPAMGEVAGVPAAEIAPEPAAAEKVPEPAASPLARKAEPPARPAAATNKEPTEVDRYTAGDATYVMFSDGSVEVRNAAGSQRYPSLDALRAETQPRQR